MGPRWKGSGAKAKALANPMSKIVSELQSSLSNSKSQGLLAGRSVLIDADNEQSELLSRSCFGRPIITVQKDRQWFELGFEEAFYLCYSMKCLEIVGDDNCSLFDEEIWLYMKSMRENFPQFYKAYSHLRMKNWVVRPGSQYGVDFVAYRHHPALVHSEYAVLVFSDFNQRLSVWSDYQCTIRVCGSVAKTLLVLNVNKNGHTEDSLLFLEAYSVEERTITRWSPVKCREDQLGSENGTKNSKAGKQAYPMKKWAMERSQGRHSTASDAGRRPKEISKVFQLIIFFVICSVAILILFLEVFSISLIEFVSLRYCNN